MKVLDPTERKKLWNQIDEASRKLGVMTMPRLHVGMKVEKGGIVLCDQREEGHSWTRNAWNAFFAHMTNCFGDGHGTFGAGYMSAKRMDAVISSDSTRSIDNNGSNNRRYIIVGTSDEAFGVDQYILGAQIADGSSAGQLSHQTDSSPEIAYESGVWTTTLKRVFNNNSGDTITVKEIGLYYSYVYIFSGSYTHYLLARDVLGSPVSVANGAQLTGTYEISMDFSSIDT